MYPPQLIPALEGFEGRVAWPYLDGDTPGNVTAAVGHRIATFADFAALPWIIPAGVTIEAEWSAIAAAAAGRLPHFYEGITTIRLSDEAIDNLRNEDLDRVAAGYDQRYRLPGWREFPVGAKCGLLDMGFNLGIGKLWEPPPHGFPHFLAAVTAGDWSAAAANCEREGVQAARNVWTKNQFLSAVTQ